MGVFNGEIGVVYAIRSGTVVINFDGRFADYPLENLGELELSYASTIHKAQGIASFSPLAEAAPSERNGERICTCSMLVCPLLSRNLFYTGITRAKQRVILVGHKKALYMAIRKSRNGKRNTLLGERITLYHCARTRTQIVRRYFSGSNPGTFRSSLAAGTVESIAFFFSFIFANSSH